MCREPRPPAWEEARGSLPTPSAFLLEETTPQRVLLPSAPLSPRHLGENCYKPPTCAVPVEQTASLCTFLNKGPRDHSTGLLAVLSAQSPGEAPRVGWGTVLFGNWKIELGPQEFPQEWGSDWVTFRSANDLKQASDPVFSALSTKPLRSQSFRTQNDHKKGLSPTPRPRGGRGGHCTWRRALCKLRGWLLASVVPFDPSSPPPTLLCSPLYRGGN